MDPSGNLNFPNVRWEWRAGSVDQDYIPGIPAVENETSVNVELRSDTPWVRSLSNTQLSAVRLRFAWPALQQQDTNGNIGGYRIEYAVDMATDGGAYQEVLREAVDGKTTTRYERSRRIDLPAATNGWQVRVRRPDAEPEQQPHRRHHAGRRLHRGDRREAALPEHGSAVRRVQRRAVQQHSGRHSRLPRAEGSSAEQLRSGDPGLPRHLGRHDETGMDQQPGMGHLRHQYQCAFRPGQADQALDGGQVGDVQDRPVLRPVGAGWEGWPGAALSVRSEPAVSRPSLDAAEGHCGDLPGMSYWAQGQLVSQADMPRSADFDYVFTRANVIDGKMTYGAASARARYSRALVSYDNPANNYDTDVTGYSDTTLLRRYGDNPVEISAIGCTRESEAQRRAKWVVLTSVQDRTISFTTGTEGRIPLPGYIIPVADSLLAGREIGGRISGVAGRVVTLDRVTQAKAGDRLIINLPSGRAEGRTVQSVNGKAVTVTAAYSETPEPELCWALDADDLAVQLYRVMSTKRDDNGQWTINGLQYEPSKFDHIDTGARLEDRPISVIPITTVPPPASVTLTSHYQFDQGLAVSTMTIAWPPWKGAVAYDVEWKKDSGNWIRLPRAGNHQRRCDRHLRRWISGASARGFGLRHHVGLEEFDPDPAQR